MDADRLSPPQRIVLIGLSGSGKSAVGRALAARLGWRAVDSDELIAAEQGRSIPDIFAREGEERFRSLEREMTARLSTAGHVVISTGGGAPLSAENRQRLWQDALVVWLRARPETLVARVATGQGNIASRPLLAGGDPLVRMRTLGAERTAVYELADWVAAVRSAP